MGAGRGSLHPALLLTFFAPDVFGSSGEMSEYWGPPSMRWQGTDLFIAQNVGQLYIGAAPVLLIVIGAVSGVLWARPVRFFTVAFGVMLVYALGWYTPAFRVIYGFFPASISTAGRRMPCSWSAFWLGILPDTWRTGCSRRRG